ncbi:hypothetical protein VTI74DRAFT_3185 [Chaetomium olivicolor]
MTCRLDRLRNSCGRLGRERLVHKFSQSPDRQEGPSSVGCQPLRKARNYPALLSQAPQRGQSPIQQAGRLTFCASPHGPPTSQRPRYQPWKCNAQTGAGRAAGAPRFFSAAAPLPCSARRLHPLLSLFPSVSPSWGGTYLLARAPSFCPSMPPENRPSSQPSSPSLSHTHPSLILLASNPRIGSLSPHILAN